MRFIQLLKFVVSTHKDLSWFVFKWFSSKTTNILSSFHCLFSIILLLFVSVCRLLKHSYIVLGNLSFLLRLQISMLCVMWQIVNPIFCVNLFSCHDCSYYQHFIRVIIVHICFQVYIQLVYHFVLKAAYIQQTSLCGVPKVFNVEGQTSWG